jgi:pimeloyl-ACP methyl ester carboxylesterase
MARARGRRRTATMVAATVAAALCALAPAAADAKGGGKDRTTWVCKPGLANDACAVGLGTTDLSPTGAPGATSTPKRAQPRKLDCFYVYPTVSNQTTPAATKAIDPEVRSIALYQAARYSQLCKVYAPVYRQITLSGIGLGASSGAVTPKMRATAYNDVRDAFRTYLRKYNHGRGFVLIGHSQGSFVLRQLVAQEVDRKASVRKRLVSAILLGGNVLVKKGSDRGGDFRNVRTCRSSKQLHCVVAFSTFGETPPANSAFGRPSRILETGPKGPPSRYEVVCTNPAALGGGTRPITTIFPSTPFAPGTTIGGATLAVGFPAPKVATPWIQANGAYTASCVSANGAHVLQITPQGGAPTLHALPDATWGLHLTDANIALGDLVALVRRQGAQYAKRS